MRGTTRVISAKGSQPALWLRAALVGMSLLYPQLGYSDDRVEIVLQDGAAQPPWDGEMGAYDQAIDYDVCLDDGGDACPTVDWRWRDAGARPTCRPRTPHGVHDTRIRRAPGRWRGAQRNF